MYIMCGLVGFIGGTSDGAAMRGELERMSRCIVHRGPDHNDLWIEPEQQIGLAHQRLSIVELSVAGAQPMTSVSGRYVIVYNGEIYNHLNLRIQIAQSGHNFEWRGHSDTETLLAAIEVWGLKGALVRSVGMFALALWDKGDKLLSLARDRLGEKPLYYGSQGSGSAATFLFGSELKALSAHPSFQANIDRRALSLYMRHGYVPAPYSIYQGISKLPPGCILRLDSAQREPVLEEYWSGADVAERGVGQPFELAPQEAVNSLDRLLSEAVCQQMMADVPLGAFLSGGVDSSTIVALMQAQSDRPVKSFSIGFDEEAYDEAKHAKAVARHLGTDHTEMYVSAHEAMDVIPSLPHIYDEPFADSSQVPTHLVSKLARRHVTVSLSGDAGDELFGGYNRYSFTSKFWRRLSKVPPPLRRTLARALTSVSQEGWNSIASAVDPLLPASARMAVPGDKIHKGAGVLASNSAAELYHGLVSSWRDPAELVIDGTEPPTLLTGNMPKLTGLNDIERMMALDMLTYLPDDILVKVDRAAMAVSLETRVPLLDHRVVEFAWRLPMEYKIRGGVTKWALRQVLYRYVPKELIERPKMGFGPPMGEWLRGSLRPWAEELLTETRLRNQGYLRPEPVRRIWESHVDGHTNEQYKLWPVLMFQAWLEAQKEAASSTSADRRAVKVA